MNTTNNRNPVVLVHGIWDQEKIFCHLCDYLQNQGWSVHTLNLTPNTGAAPLETLAEQVANFVQQRFKPDQRFDLVGFSMGGLVTRYYIQRLGGVERVQRYVTISAPHHGTITAYGLPLKGVHQMRPESNFLKDLNRDAVEILGRLQFTSIWTPYDLMIVPAQSSQMPVGEEIKLSVAIHRWMVSDPTCLEAIAKVLSVPISQKDLFPIDL
jgi:triacylglycerol lipase